MAIVMSVANQKGGVGKTTTVTSLAAGMTLRGLKVLVIDADPQSSTSDTFRMQMDGVTTLYDIFNGTPITEAIQQTSQGDIVPGDMLLSDADETFKSIGREYILKDAISPILNDYDYIIIDTPPHIGLLIYNAFTASDSIIIPMCTDRYSAKGMTKLIECINKVKLRPNPDLIIEGILLTKYDGRTVLSRYMSDAINEIATSLNTKLFDTKIRNGIAIPESQTSQKTIFEYAPYCAPARDYTELIKEIEKKIMEG